jgi:two-component system chemotaxis response regulator CheY
MRTLIAEDDSCSRQILQEVLSPYGPCDIAINGQQAVDSFRLALADSNPYHLICMDIMMPIVDGQQALLQIRQIEKDLGISKTNRAKVIMATALSDSKQVMDAIYKGGACSYFVKPIQIDAFLKELKALGLIGNPA